ncbi:hypothetical protein Gferi_04760 [Geosporobacter ferrireducens]|uniref:Uncharacterized protein n=2 Tax=Geosporobacter ferrireducens TaxID=1424294 RepID=A0A1D8GDE7_9FIRM|nr:hypothetical protein Gferi_04760 [Geosporobacter ferrireducens]
MNILMQSKPEDVEKECMVKLKFLGVEDMNLEGWYSCNIVLDIEFEYERENIKSMICASLGLTGCIVSKSMSAEIKFF